MLHTRPLNKFYIHSFFSSSCSLPSGAFAYLLLFDAFIDLGGGLLVRPEQADDTGPLWLQDVSIFIPDHLVQLQDPVAEEAEVTMGRMEGSNTTNLGL